MAAKQDESHPGTAQSVAPADPLDLLLSVAGEEDPGASVVCLKPAGDDSRSPISAQPTMAPGDEAPLGTPGTGENVCPECGGTGRLGAGKCANCLGTGVVIVGIGGA
jgi:DnaJ-class molecular chaperone with C-terminal Zn finger domain